MYPKTYESSQFNIVKSVDTMYLAKTVSSFHFLEASPRPHHRRNW